MSWIFIVVIVLALFLLIYVFYPSIKKIFFSKKTSSSSTIDFKKERKKEKEAKKLDRKEDKKRKLEEKEDKKLDNKRINVEIIENKIDLFEDDLKEESFEDPDTKVNYDNFDLDGLFENENQNIESKKQISETNNIYSQKFDELFEDFKTNYNPKSTKINNLGLNKKIEFEDNNEIADFLSENNFNIEEEGELRKEFDKLPDEIKVLILSDFLNRKDN